VWLWDATFGAESLVLPGLQLASFSLDGTRILNTANVGKVVVHDSRPHPPPGG
jgi:hypothetical protein